MTNPIREAFERIEAGDELEQATLEFLRRERARREAPKAVFRFKPALAMACMLFLLIAGFGAYRAAGVPVSYISIDVNPSIELSLNSFDRVIDAAAFNDDGELVLVRWMWRQAHMRSHRSHSGAPLCSHILTADSQLSFTVASSSPDREAALLDSISDCTSCKRYSGLCFSAQPELIEEAHDNQLSFGKYSAYLTLSQFDSSVTVEQCRQMTMAELRELIREYQGGCDTASGDCAQQGGRNETAAGEKS